MEEPMAGIAQNQRSIGLDANNSVSGTGPTFKLGVQVRSDSGTQKLKQLRVPIIPNARIAELKAEISRRLMKPGGVREGLNTCMADQAELKDDKGYDLDDDDQIIDVLENNAEIVALLSDSAADTVLTSTSHPHQEMARPVHQEAELIEKGDVVDLADSGHSKATAALRSDSSVGMPLEAEASVGPHSPIHNMEVPTTSNFDSGADPYPNSPVAPTGEEAMANEPKLQLDSQDMEFPYYTIGAQLPPVGGTPNKHLRYARHP
jgi:hypothetical protein